MILPERKGYELFNGRWVKWAFAESRREMMQDKMKFVCQGATPWKTGIFLRGRVELFTGGWVSCCWVPKRDDTENEKNEYNTNEGNRKRKYSKRKDVLHYNEFFYFVFHDLGSNTVHKISKSQTKQGRYDGDEE